MKNNIVKPNRSRAAADLKLLLCEHRFERMILHLGCRVRGGRVWFYRSGMRRECRTMISWDQMGGATRNLRSLILGLMLAM